MALSSNITRLLAFFLVFSVVFPIASFALEFESGQPDSGDLDPDSLSAAGVILTDTTTHNISKGASQTFYVLNSSVIGCRWYSSGNFRFTVQIWGGIFAGVPPVYNETWVIGNFSTTYNWTRITIDANAPREADGFFTVHAEYDNMTHCINDGNVTLTIGRNFKRNPADFFAFTGWYLGIITGVATGGLPQIFVWFTQMLFIIGIISAVLLVKEFIPFLP